MWDIFFYPKKNLGHKICATSSPSNVAQTDIPAG